MMIREFATSWSELKGEIIIVTAQDPSKKEILLNTMSPEAVRKYNSALRRRTTQFLYYDPAVVDLTGRIREYYKQRGEKVPTSADAEHLAYAIHYKVDEFHTFDKGKKGGADLLAMDGNVAGHSLDLQAAVQAGAARVQVVQVSPTSTWSLARQRSMLVVTELGARSLWEACRGAS